MKVFLSFNIFTFAFVFAFVIFTLWDLLINVFQLSTPILNQRAPLNPLATGTEPMSRPIQTFLSLAAAPWQMITPKPPSSGLAIAHVPAKDSTTTALDSQLRQSEQRSLHHTQISSGLRPVTQMLKKQAS
jgi:hypothetical protein